MITGNIQAQSVLNEFFGRVATGGGVAFPFLLLSGPSGIGKTSLVESHIQSALGVFIAQDYLPLYDLSNHLEKEHTLKVSVSSKDQIVNGKDGKVYKNLGARDCIQWLSLGPAGGLKVLFLENIERMNASSANALLKSLEEPLPNRLIIATTQNYKELLDTIISRALIVRFHPLSQEDVRVYIDEHYQHVAVGIRHFVVAYTAGRMGEAITLLESGTGLGQMSEIFEASLHYYRSGGSLVKQYQRMQKRGKEIGSLEDLVDAVVYALGTDPSNNNLNVEKLIKAKKLFGTNVSNDAIMFSMSI